MPSATTSPAPATELARPEGVAFFSAAEAIVKGVLESDIPVSLICGPRRNPFAGLFRLRGSETVANLLRQHGTRLQTVPDARRAIALAWQSAGGGRHALAAIPADQLDQVQHRLRRLGRRPLSDGAVVVILEDRPSDPDAPSPRSVTTRLDWPVIEPSDVGELRDSVEAALRLSRASDHPAAIIAHDSLLHSAETIVVHPNRILSATDRAAAGPGRRRQRVPDVGDVLRVGRRLELNRVHNMPSPGERVPVGFIAIGIAAATLRHLVDVLGLVGRVPALELRLEQPVDIVAVGRLLTRCEHIVVLEPRPGEVELTIISVAEQLRRQGERPASVWGRVVPPDPSGEEHRLGPDDATHPSVLVRRIVHLLHSIRPTLQVASRLIPDVEQIDLDLEPRRSSVGSGGAGAALRTLVAEANVLLEEAAAADEEVELTRLRLEPERSEASDVRTVQVEIWEHRPFVEEGMQAVVQAARDDRPRLMLVCEQGGEDIGDLERLARGIVPAERAARVKVDAQNLSDRAALLEAVTQAAPSDGLTILVVRDGPPARYDVATLERSVVEIDRLGFQPRQTITCPADLACSIRTPADSALRASRFGRDAEPLRTEITLGRRSRPRGLRVQVSVQPMLEQIDVLRERPPAWHDRLDAGEGVPMPQPLHARQPQWRVHLAGFRSEAPGPLARVLCMAGSLMGYAVKCVSDPEPVAPARRAWTQVLFTRPRKGEDLSPLTAIAPYGEADLLLGLDASESLRAIAADSRLRVAVADHTFAVINSGRFDLDEDADPGRREIDAAAFARLGLLRPQPQLIDDVAAACRAWFHTDRVTDFALLGAAFQLGLIPLTLDAIEGAIEEVERTGFGRSLDAFRFGRRFAVDPRPAARRRPDRQEPLERVGRRIVLSIRGGQRRGLAAAQQFGALLRRSLGSMPGLTETDRGRQARRDYVHGLQRCFVWGGLEYAAQYADLVTALYHEDRGDTGRALTRNLVLPLAEAMLIRDPIYVAAMATSTEQRRRTRQRLDVKHARGDRIVRRFLTRIEVAALGRSLRLDLRTGEWAARRLASLRRVVPTAWRGSRASRGLRAQLIGFAKRVCAQTGEDYEHWNAVARRLHALAEEGRLASSSPDEIQRWLEPESNEGGEAAVGAVRS